MTISWLEHTRHLYLNILEEIELVFQYLFELNSASTVNLVSTPYWFIWKKVFLNKTLSQYSISVQLDLLVYSFQQIIVKSKGEING